MFSTFSFVYETRKCIWFTFLCKNWDHSSSSTLTQVLQNPFKKILFSLSDDNFALSNVTWYGDTFMIDLMAIITHVPIRKISYCAPETIYISVLSAKPK